MWLIVGLGNPGPEYALHRHNIGAIAVERWASAEGEKFGRSKQAQALVATTGLGDARVVLAFPQTFMNNSGAAVKALMSFYKIPAEQVVVLHDELDLDFNILRMKLGGGDNGHNGLKSIRAALGHGDFNRLRMGIGRPTNAMDPAVWVLRNFGKSEQAEIDEFCTRARDAVECLMKDGLAVAQGRFNQ